MMQFSIETEQETDGRWIAEIEEIPGVMAYGTTEEGARRNAHSLALDVTKNQSQSSSGWPEPRAK